MVGRRKFDKQYKLDAVAPVIEGSISQSDRARELGINHTLISRWCRELLSSPQEAFPGNGNMPESAAELARLRRECERLKAENEILKKAITIFGRGPQ